MPGLLDLFTGGGMTGSSGGGPIDYLRSRVQSWQAHPFQNIASTVIGGLGGPAAGLGANAAFNRYNDNRFTNATQQLQDRSSDLSQLNTNDAMNRPLGNDALSGNNGFNWTGPTGPNDGSGGMGGPIDGGSAQGMGGGMHGGGPLPPTGYGGPSMTGQQWQDRGGGYGNLVGQTQGVAPDQPSSFVNDILDSISMGPGLPGSGQRNHQQIQSDYRDGTSNVGPGIGNYGVSNMMVGGSPVVFGGNGFDPNGAATYNRRGVGY